MLKKRLNVMMIASRRSLMDRMEKRILRNVLTNGVSYPGDVLRDLGLSSNMGLKKIFELRRKGYLLKYNNTSLLQINPDKRKTVKILTTGM